MNIHTHHTISISLSLMFCLKQDTLFRRYQFPQILGFRGFVNINNSIICLYENFSLCFKLDACANLKSRLQLLVLFGFLLRLPPIFPSYFLAASTKSTSSVHNCFPSVFFSNDIFLPSIIALPFLRSFAESLLSPNPSSSPASRPVRPGMRGAGSGLNKVTDNGRPERHLD